jgi:hypothetical protein
VAISPEQTFDLGATVGTSEVTLATVPSDKAEMKVYGILVSELSGSDNTLELRVYKGTDLEKSFKVSVPAKATVGILQLVDSPIMGVLSGRRLAAVAGAASVSVLLSAYYL